MGNCNKSFESDHSRDINIYLRQSHEQDISILKVLLLGTGESGKSTIFKQARTSFGRRYDKKELIEFRSKVYHNIVYQVQSCILFRRFHDIELKTKEIEQSEDFVMSIKRNTILATLEDKYFGAIKIIWSDPAYRLIWQRRNEFQVFDCLAYFLDKANFQRIRTAGTSYIPTYLDALQCRDKTTGIRVEKLRIENSPFELYDVGGQRAERRKWLNCFDNVTTIIYAAAINEFDQTLYEANGVNRMHESLRVFDDVVNREQFRQISFLLFLNKWDLFVSKLKKVSYKVAGKRNDDYTGSEPSNFEEDSTEQKQAIEECYEHTMHKFISRIKDYKRRSNQITVFKTVATAEDTMKKVFQACQQQLLASVLAGSGFTPLAI